MLKQELKKYDSYLDYKKQLDGSLTVFRQSPFNSQKQFTAFTIKNQYPGDWILQKIMSMDNQRIDIGGRILENNRRIKEAKSDDRITREIVDMWSSGGDKIIL